MKEDHLSTLKVSDDFQIKMDNKGEMRKDNGLTLKV